MKKTTVVLGATLCVMVLVLGVAYASTQRASPTTSIETPVATVATTTSETPAPVAETPAPTGYTLAVVATHNSASSCWTAINGSVYDVTSWISKHPGGSQAILSLCGKDGSSAFNGQHGGDRRPESELANFRIGALN